MKNESEVRYRLLMRSIPLRGRREGGREEEREGGRENPEGPQEVSYSRSFPY